MNERKKKTGEQGGWWGVALFVPLALAQGIIPYTHTVLFEEAFRVSRRPGMALREDLMNAAGIGLLVCSVGALFYAACYVSLSGAFGEKERQPRARARRAIRTRLWIYPLLGFMGVPARLVGWALPKSAHGALGAITFAAMVVPLFMLVSGLKRHAERSGVSKGAAWLVVLVPLLLSTAVEAVLVGSPPGGGLLEAWLPSSPPQ